MTSDDVTPQTRLSFRNTILGMATTTVEGKPCLSKRRLVLHPGEEVEVVLETSVVVEEVVLAGMTTWSWRTLQWPSGFGGGRGGGG